MRIDTEGTDNACGDAGVPKVQVPLMQSPSAQVQVVALECLPRIPAHKLSTALASEDLGKRILLCLSNSSKEVLPLPKFPAVPGVHLGTHHNAVLEPCCTPSTSYSSSPAW